MSGNYFYKFDSEAEAIAKLPQFRSTDEDGNPTWITGGYGWALWIVGEIIRESGPTPGWHVNYCSGQGIEGLDDYLVFPENPVTKF